MKFEIDTTELNKDERNELAKSLFKCGYAIRLDKRRDGSKIKYIIVCEKGGFDERQIDGNSQKML